MIGKGIKYYLELSTDVTSIVKSNIFPLVTPQNIKLPAITYQVISSEPANDKDGPAGYNYQLVYVNHFANSYDIAIDLANKSRIALEKKSGYSVDGKTMDYIAFDDERHLTESDNTIVHIQHQYRIGIK